MINLKLKIINQIRLDTSIQVREQICDQIRHHSWEQIWKQVRWKVSVQIKEHVRDRINQAMDNK